MRHLLFAAALVLASAGGLYAQDPPKGPAPLIMTASAGKDGRPVLLQLIHEAVPVQREVTVNVNGQPQKRTVTEMVYVSKTVSIPLDEGNVRVFDVAGKQLDAKAIKLMGATPVLVSSNGQPVDAFYTRLAREGTLVIVSPRFVGGGAVMPVAPSRPIKLPPPPRQP
jgi:hypothetical protein